MMNDVPSQDELDAEIPRMRKRNKSYRAFIIAIRIWFLSRRIGWPLTLKQAFQVVEDANYFDTDDTSSR